MSALTTDITPGWNYVSIGFEGDQVSLGGLNPWQFEWHALNQPPITVAHPSYAHQRHSMWLYVIHAAENEVKFAAGEFSNGVWGFYVPVRQSFAKHGA
jgi:hypothetical protein